MGECARFSMHAWHNTIFLDSRLSLDIPATVDHTLLKEPGAAHMALNQSCGFEPLHGPY
jgi:hypothetical protein